MVDTLTLPNPPSVSGYSEQFAPRVSKARFGDGYEQRVVDGINANPISVQVSCRFLTSSQKATLQAFLAAKGGWEAFYYTLPSEASPRLFKCEQWSFSSVQASLWDIALTLEEVFDYA